MHQSREKPLLIFGPPGIKEFLELMRKCLRFNPQYFLDIREITAGRFFSGQGFSMEAVTVDHGPHTLAFSLEEDPRPGRFYPEKAKDLGVPEGPLFGQLQQGKTLTLPGGQVITPAMVMGPPRKGRKFVYVSDTRPCPQATALAQGADLLIHEGMFGEEMADEANKKGHSTVSQAATIAVAARAKKLVITHISSRYHRVDDLIAEARRIFPEAVIGRDLMEFAVPVHKE